MKIFLERIFVINRAPFENLNLDFEENGIAVLTAINGRGKTTILSYIVDAWHEMIRNYFPNEFEGKENEYYRVSSSFFNINRNEPSFVYVRFKTPEGHIDYVDICNNCTQQQYDDNVKLNDKILFNEINHILEENDSVKLVSKTFNKKKADAIFNNNVITYFPTYRYEVPGYLNDPYKIHLDFTKEMSYFGFLPNPLEVVTGLPLLANWIMDIVLDMELYKQIQNIPLPDGGVRTIDVSTERNVLWNSLNKIISQTLISKKYDGVIRFGIGKRNSGSTRIALTKENGVVIHPSIFNLSSGETAMLCMFGEILRQADKNKKESLEQITGIVLIDEVDKHLHIKLQKEVLPLLFNLFPNVQFIVSSHSPFLNIGLAEKSKDRAKIIDLDNNGISVDTATNELYTEVYEMMINENNRFAEKYNALQETIKKATKPLVITEGKTDVKHLKRAMQVLDIRDCDIEFYEINEDWGDSKLKTLLEQLSKVDNSRVIIGIFDRDVAKIINDIEKDNQPHKNFTNNVYAFCIPIPTGREQYTNISIEFYYSDNEIKKEKNGRRLYFDNEIEYLHNKTKNTPEYRKLESPELKKETIKRIFDEDKMCEVANWIHSKASFANLILNDEDFSRDFDFSNFNLIFDKIKEIIKDGIT